MGSGILTVSILTDILLESGLTLTEYFQTGVGLYTIQLSHLKAIFILIQGLIVELSHPSHMTAFNDIRKLKHPEN